MLASRTPLLNEAAVQVRGRTPSASSSSAASRMLNAVLGYAMVAKATRFDNCAPVALLHSTSGYAMVAKAVSF